MPIDKEEQSINRKLMDFLDQSPNAFFAVENMKQALEKGGFKALYEGEAWKLKAGEKYYVTRNGSALIASVQPGGANHSAILLHIQLQILLVNPDFRIGLDFENRRITVAGHHLEALEIPLGKDKGY